MCTCINVFSKSNLFGRTLDIEYSFNEQIIIVPRNFPITFKKEKNINSHYAIYGIGTIVDNYPLFADCSNEKGLSFASLNFVNNAYFSKVSKTDVNLTNYELPLYLLSKCKNLKEVKILLKKINIIDIPINKKTPTSELHFMMSYKNQSIVIEATKEGLSVYDNPYHVLTNNPPFPYHKYNLSLYSSLSNKESSKSFFIPPKEGFSNGLGGINLPGDYSSPSRFIRAFFIKEMMSDKDDISTFFKCLDSVSLIKGVVITSLGSEYTLYTSCYDVKNLTLHYKTYDDNTISNIKFSKNDFNKNNLITYPMKKAR